MLCWLHVDSPLSQCRQSVFFLLAKCVQFPQEGNGRAALLKTASGGRSHEHTAGNKIIFNSFFCDCSSSKTYRKVFNLGSCASPVHSEGSRQLSQTGHVARLQSILCQILQIFLLLLLLPWQHALPDARGCAPQRKLTLVMSLVYYCGKKGALLLLLWCSCSISLYNNWATTSYFTSTRNRTSGRLTEPQA